MTASSLIDWLAGRGLVLSIEGARIRASPKKLLTDQDRRLIRQFRDDLFALLSKGVAAKTCEEAEREAIREEPLIASSPDSRFHDELAGWPISWREVWGWVTNAIEDAFKAEGMPTGGADLAAFTEVSRIRGDGMTPEEALIAIWDLLGLPGEPPILGLESEWPSPRPEPLSDAEALRQIEDDPWPEVSHATSVAEGRCWNTSVVDGHSSRRAPKGYWPSPHDWRPGHCRLV